LSQISIFFGNLTIFWQNEPHIDQEVDVKKATDQEQETWVMPAPRYIAEISIFLPIWPFFWQNEPHIDK